MCININKRQTEQQQQTPQTEAFRFGGVGVPRGVCQSGMKTSAVAAIIYTFPRLGWSRAGCVFLRAEKNQ